MLLYALVVAFAPSGAAQEPVARVAEESTPVAETTAAAASDAPADGTRFLIVPYPIVDPAIGNGLLLGPVWMRGAPRVGSEPSKPQAFGAGAIWTDGGTRGAVAFDHRAWKGGLWRSTAVAAKLDLHFTYSGVVPGRDVGFQIDAAGLALTLERSLGEQGHGLNLSLYAADADVSFDSAPPALVQQDLGTASLYGIRLGWTRDTRDHVFLPSSGHAMSAAVTAWPEALGTSFDAQTLNLKWTGYRPVGKGVIGLRAKADFSFGDPPFYLRPFVAFRGVAALRYPGESVVSAEAEYRRPINARFDLLLFGGTGRASADFRGLDFDKTVSAAGVGIRFKPAKLFGMTFGIDYAHGPDGGTGYLQIGNVWTN